MTIHLGKIKILWTMYTMKKWASSWYSIKILYYNKTIKGNQLNDKHSAMYDKIFDTVLKRERHLTYFSFCTPLLSLCYGSQL